MLYWQWWQYCYLQQRIQAFAACWHPGWKFICFFNIRLIPSDMPSFQSFSNFWYMMYILSLWEEYNASKYQHYSVNSLKHTCNWVCKALESEFLSILFKWILQVRLVYFLGFTLFFLFEESLTPPQMLESFYKN